MPHLVLYMHTYKNLIWWLVWVIQAFILICGITTLHLQCSSASDFNHTISSWRDVRNDTFHITWQELSIIQRLKSWQQTCIVSRPQTMHMVIRKSNNLFLYQKVTTLITENVKPPPLLGWMHLFFPARFMQQGIQ